MNGECAAVAVVSRPPLPAGVIVVVHCRPVGLWERMVEFHWWHGLDSDIDTEIDINSGIKKFARFPAKYRWDRNFRLLEKRMGNCSGQGALPKYSFSTYRRE